MYETLPPTADEDLPGRLFITDAELIRRLGVPEKIARQAIFMLDRNRKSGFSKKEPLWGKRRYWPAVRAWFDRTRIGIFSQGLPRRSNEIPWKENFDAPAMRRPRRFGRSHEPCPPQSTTIQI
jgi:hypothetical protein